jgi:hypothetical protein
MDTVKSAIAHTVDRATASKKVADLHNDIVDASGATSAQRTDYGALIANGDAWCVVPISTRILRS